jgi:hypothetical protein
MRCAVQMHPGTVVSSHRDLPADLYHPRALTFTESERSPRATPCEVVQIADLVVRKSACFSLRAVDAGEDLVGVLGPGERSGVVVPVVDEGADRLGELAD